MGEKTRSKRFDRQKVQRGGAVHKKSEAPQSTISGDAQKSLDSKFPILNFPNIAHLTVNDKDFSFALEMTIRENPISPSLPVTSP